MSTIQYNTDPFVLYCNTIHLVLTMSTISMSDGTCVLLVENLLTILVKTKNAIKDP